MHVQTEDWRTADRGVVITGSAGRIGRLLMKALPGAIGLDLPACDLSTVTPQLPEGARVVALAAHPDGCGSYETAWAANTAIFTNTVRACIQARARCLVFASSVWVEHRAWSLSDTLTWYAAAKHAGELLCRAWAEACPDRTAVALRIGGYDPDIPVDLSCRVDGETLTEAFQAALNLHAPGFLVRYAVGTKSTWEIGRDER